ncbi:MAG: serine/threonine dehydratase [Planctomycetes bacterium]|nr:serine/threonine dehydratase [Planctomycetota bacterium]
MDDPPLPTLEDVRAAAARVAPHVRRTPLLPATALRRPLGGAPLRLKLECLQVTGSFKARGAVNRVLALDPAVARRGVVTASGGNHGTALAYAARLVGAPAVVFVPTSAPAGKRDALARWGADVVVAGDVWDDAQAAALERAERDGLTYVHPFADPDVVAGQGTLGLEVGADAPDADTVLVAVGGGGLIGGVALALPGVRVVGVEPAGAPTLHDSLAAGALVTLPRITTAAGSLAPRRSAPLNLALARRHVERVVLVDDDALRAGARWLWEELGVGAELGGAAAVAALLAGAYAPADDERVVAVVCGAGTDHP